MLAILGLGVALVLPSLTGSLESARFRQGAAELRAAMSQARSRAAATGRGRTVRFDLDRRQYGIPSDNVARTLPEGVRVVAVASRRGTAEEGIAELRFHPDGSADEAEVVLSDAGGARIRLRVDPLTGLVEAGT